MVHLDIDPRTYALLKARAEAEERTLKAIAARAVRHYAAAEAEEEVLDARTTRTGAA